MKKIIIVALLFLFFACDEKKNKYDVEVMPVAISIERFDSVFYEMPDAELPKLKQSYPFLFPATVSDSVWLSKKKDTLLQHLYSEVKQRYATTTKLEKELGDVLARIKKYFPKEKKIERVITVISEVDTEAKAIYANPLVLLSLDCYLGGNHIFYESFPSYRQIEFSSQQIIPDVVTNFAMQKVPYPKKDKSLLAQMVYFGKIQYIKDVLLPTRSDADKIQYTTNQINWCKENELPMWQYFVEKNLLYSTDYKNNFRFIEKAPFSKFYLEIDNESPGRTGQWIGWQIVRSFMNNNEVSLQEMLTLDAKTLFEQSKYKPKK